eukprot:TRINITY_DN13629_c0_g1_i1.p1 TRINITY_DN13629_c0_g1~~TRINITY_DN13629_c0_g1_i1.p1  ORF type:complete len:505 (+),score=130.73 TRINITY_DN13629_c0_g1_i1:68-1516(+)
MSESDIEDLLCTYKRTFENINLHKKEPLSPANKNASNLRELNRVSKLLCTKLGENSRNLTERLKTFLQSPDSTIHETPTDPLMTVNRSNHYLKAHRLLQDLRRHNQRTDYLNTNNPTKSLLVKNMRKKEARLISWMLKFRKAYAKAEEETSVPRGNCVLCDEPQQHYCGTCEERMKYYRQSHSLDIYANQLLKIKSMEVQGDIDQYLTQRIAFVKRRNEYEMKVQRLAYLKKMRDLLKSDYEMEEVIIEKMKQGNTKRLMETETLRNAYKKRLKKPSKVPGVRQKRLECSQVLVNERRKKLRELKILLPISPRNDKVLFLKVELQKNAKYFYRNVQNKEHLSFILGYQLLLVQLLSLYLEIPLKYTMKFMSSQSSIGMRSEKQLTLHPDVTNEFETAVQYLSRNVYNLVRQYNVIIDCKGSRDFPLVNLYFLLNKEDLGSLLPKMMLVTTSMFRSMSTTANAEKGFLLVDKKTTPREREKRV